MLAIGMVCSTEKKRWRSELLNEFFFFAIGTSVCEGDSGGSMTFEDDNGLFYIRGIVSLSAVKKDDATGQISCDTSNYVLFTDVAQFLPWIKKVANECQIAVQCDSAYM